MKKYVKPDLFYENFQLTSSVAKNCGTMVGFTSQTCKMELDEDGLPNTFLFAGDNCDIDYRHYDRYCYETGNASMQLFNS